jgi:hypothetical protein
MKSNIQLSSIIIALLLLGAAITFSSTPHAENLGDWPYDYWLMLGNYQASTD